MSGGSMDYLYVRVQEEAVKLKCSKNSLRKAFGNHLLNVSKALKDTEWVDSCDSSEGAEHESIRMVLGPNWKLLQLDEVKQEAKKLVDELTELLK